MKQYVSTVLGLVCVLLIGALFLVKNTDNTRHKQDVGTITDFSNQLATAQTHLAIDKGEIILFSNRLAECQSVTGSLSNQLNQATAAIALRAEQITNLNQRITGLTTKNQALIAQVSGLTNQVAGLTSQVKSTQASLQKTSHELAQTTQQYGLLENRLRRDVGERLVTERKFNNPSALQAQLQNLKQNPPKVISAQSIYAGLGVEVNSNGTFHVLSLD